MSRLESLEVTIQQQIELLSGNQLDAMDGLYRDVVGSGYIRTAFDFQRAIGIGWDITAPDEERLGRLLSQPWSTDGRTFRDRCGVQKEELRTAVQKSLIQGLLRGDPPLRTSETIKTQFGVSQYKAARLINTETTYFNALSARESYRDLHVDRVEIIETPDSSTCELCGGLDGTVILISQFEPGVTVPPFHPNCRGTTAPAIDPKYADGERFARGEDGEVYYIPADMTYEEWKAAFVDGGSKAGLISAAGGGIIKLSDSVGDPLPITEEAIASVPYITELKTPELSGRVHDWCQKILRSLINEKANTEATVSIALGGSKHQYLKGDPGTGAVEFIDLDQPYISIHNHPSGETISATDVLRYTGHKNCMGVVVIGNNSSVYAIYHQKIDCLNGIEEAAEIENRTNITSYAYRVMLGLVGVKNDNELWGELEKYGIKCFTRKYRVV